MTREIVLQKECNWDGSKTKEKSFDGPNEKQKRPTTLAASHFSKCPRFPCFCPFYVCNKCCIGKRMERNLCPSGLPALPKNIERGPREALQMGEHDACGEEPQTERENGSTKISLLRVCINLRQLKKNNGNDVKNKQKWGKKLESFSGVVLLTHTHATDGRWTPAFYPQRISSATDGMSSLTRHSLLIQLLGFCGPWYLLKNMEGRLDWVRVNRQQRDFFSSSLENSS